MLIGGTHLIRRLKMPKIVIDLSYEDYNIIKEHDFEWNGCVSNLFEAVKNGTVLLSEEENIADIKRKHPAYQIVPMATIKDIKIEIKNRMDRLKKQFDIAEVIAYRTYGEVLSIISEHIEWEHDL